jgi:hypothetical protein
MASTLYDLFVAQPTGLTLSFVTAAVGAIALYIYFRQHKDEKVLAALTIFSEISSAENALTGIRSRFFATEFPTLEENVIMRHESWSNYKHLFLKDLTRDEWGIIDQFYTNCLNYDAAILINKTNIRLLIEENYRHQYDHYAEVVQEYHYQNPSEEELPADKIDQLLVHQRLFLSDKTKSRYDYIPRQGVAEARTALVGLDTSVTSSTAGQRLRKLAKL